MAPFLFNNRCHITESLIDPSVFCKDAPKSLRAHVHSTVGKNSKINVPRVGHTICAYSFNVHTSTLQDDEDNQGGAAPATDMGGQHRTVRQEPRPFKVLDYVVRIEWQKRGYPHAHILLWADVPDVATKHRPEDAPDDIDWSDEEEREAAVPTCAEDLSDKYICTKSAHRWKEDIPGWTKKPEKSMPNLQP